MAVVKEFDLDTNLDQLKSEFKKYQKKLEKKSYKFMDYIFKFEPKMSGKRVGYFLRLTNRIQKESKEMELNLTLNELGLTDPYCQEMFQNVVFPGQPYVSEIQWVDEDIDALSEPYQDFFFYRILSQLIQSKSMNSDLTDMLEKVEEINLQTKADLRGNIKQTPLNNNTG